MFTATLPLDVMRGMPTRRLIGVIIGVTLIYTSFYIELEVLKNSTESYARNISLHSRIRCKTIDAVNTFTKNVDIDFNCSDPHGVIGEWIHDPTRYFYGGDICCGYDRFPKFVRHNYTNCRYKKSNPKFFTGETGQFYQQFGGRACSCGASFRDQYIWSSPSLAPDFDKDLTCRRLNNRTVLMIGDSTMSQTAVALMNSFTGTNCSQQIHYVMSDHLIDPPDPKDERGMAWSKALRKFPSDIVVLTAGAHIQENTNWKQTIDDVLEEIRETRRNYSNHEENSPVFVFKTQQPGGCSKEIQSPNPADANRAYNYSQYQSYSHRYFYQRDLYLLSKLKEYGILSMDLRMLYSRTDAKISSRSGNFGDCLHLCWPGPLDVIGRLFDALLDEIDNQ